MCGTYIRNKLQFCSVVQQSISLKTKKAKARIKNNSFTILLLFSLASTAKHTFSLIDATVFLAFLFYVIQFQCTPKFISTIKSALIIYVQILNTYDCTLEDYKFM